MIRMRQRGMFSRRRGAKPDAEMAASARHGPAQRPGNQALQHLLRTHVVQAKLTVNTPGDRYEQEADRVADQVLRMPATGPAAAYHSPPIIQRMCSECEEEVHRQPEPPTLQRMCSECEHELHRQETGEEEEELLQAKAAPGHVPEVSPGAASQIASLQGGGRPLPAETRAFLEPRFGYDFGGVRVHADARTAGLARSVQARAFTVGHDVVFGAGEYAPGTDEGKRLLAHELTHVVQQRPPGLVSRQAADNDLTADRFRGDAVLEAVYDGRRLLRVGDRGEAVRKLQQALLDAGLELPIHGVDGDFGPETKVAVEGFQRGSGLGGADIDGVVGPITMGWLDQRFSAGPTPAGTEPGSTQGCAAVQTVTVDIVSLQGSNRDAVSDLNYANTVFNQCCVRFDLQMGVSASQEQTDAWLGGDTTLDNTMSCSRPTQEEKDLREFATAELGLSSRYKVFYMDQLSTGQRGLNFSPDCSSGDRAPFNRHVYVTNGAAQRTLAHELGHIPIRGLRDHTAHGDGTRNLMEPTNTATGEHLTEAQCREVRANI